MVSCEPASQRPGRPGIELLRCNVHRAFDQGPEHAVARLNHIDGPPFVDDHDGRLLISRQFLHLLQPSGNRTLMPLILDVLPRRRRHRRCSRTRRWFAPLAAAGGCRRVTAAAVSELFTCCDLRGSGKEREPTERQRRNVLDHLHQWHRAQRSPRRGGMPDRERLRLGRETWFHGRHAQVD